MLGSISNRALEGFQILLNNIHPRNNVIEFKDKNIIYKFPTSYQVELD